MAQGTGNIANANDAVSVVTEGMGSVAFIVTGTWVGTLRIEATIDDQNWFAVNGINPNTTNIFSAFASNLQFFVLCGGFSQVRVRASAFTSGTAVAAWDVGGGSNGIAVVTQGSISSAAPSYSAGAIGQMSLTTAGGLRTQDLKDGGRTYITLTAVAIAGVTSEALISFTKNAQGSTTGSVTSYTITSGKTFRVQGIFVGLRAGAAAIQWVQVNLRHNTAGATTASSPLVVGGYVGTGSTTSGVSATEIIPVPDGLEFFGNGTQSIGVSHLSSATTNVEFITLVGYEY